MTKDLIGKWMGGKAGNSRQAGTDHRRDVESRSPPSKLLKPQKKNTSRVDFTRSGGRSQEF